MDIKEFNVDEFFEIARRLEDKHLIFSRLWMLGKPTLTDKVPISAVSFDNLGKQINFLINPDGWQELSNVQRDFIISHECMHCILYHGVRASAISVEDRELANIAMDIVINHFLVDSANFKREEIDPTNKYCWIDTVFGAENVQSGETFEYYFDLLKKKDNALAKSGGASPNDKSVNGKQQIGVPGKGSSLVDSHDFLESFDDKAIDSILKESSFNTPAKDLDKFVQKQIDNDLKDLCTSRGMSPGSMSVFVNIEYVRPKKKWETVIKKWAKKVESSNEIEQWTKPDRRMVSMSNEFFIPTWIEDENKKKDRITVWFFQDTSGSCAHLAKRFFKAAKTLPKDRFDVKMFCFDTSVYETSLESGKLYGFGGTSFTCIENYINVRCRRDNIPYPKSVWVVTDGYGDNVAPLNPERWHWFLSCNMRSCIPKESNVYMLSEFE